MITRIQEIQKTYYSTDLNERIKSRLQEILQKTQHLILYHATTTKFKQNILEHGFISRRRTKNSTWEDRRVGKKSLKSKIDNIYFNISSSYFFSNMAVYKWGGEKIIFDLLVDKTKLLPDEDSGKKTGLESILEIGTACVKSRLEPKNIIGYKIKNKNKNILKKMKYGKQTEHKLIFNGKNFSGEIERVIAITYK